MSTSSISFRRHARRGALALVVTALLVPASPAFAQGDTPADYPGVTGSPRTSSPVGDTPADYSGVTGNLQTAPVGDTPADYPGVPGSSLTSPPVASHASEASGFDWTSAGIGAGAAGLLIVVLLVGATAAPRLRFRGVRS